MARARDRRRKRGVGGTADDTPPLMWPESGSGYEASPFSPAGRSEAGWRMLQGMRNPNVPRWARVTMWVFALAFLAMAALGVMSSLAGVFR